MTSADADAGVRLRTLETGAPLEDALALFDALPPVTVEQLLGAWRGADLRTGHRLDGLLESLGWHGKWFDGPDDVHPLVFADERGLFSVNPAAVPLPVVVRYGDLLHTTAVLAAGRRGLRLLRTRKPGGRLRMVEHRGVVTGTLVYDALPVNDHFRLVDDDTVLGAMDARGLEDPFVFVLRRESGPERG